MKKAPVLLSALLLVSLLLACAPQAGPAPAPQAPAPAAAPRPAPLAPAAVAAPAKPAWEAEWEKVVTAAKKEGKVMLATALGAEPRAFLVRDFNKTYGISLEAIAGRSSEMNTKILAERRAGMYLWDVTVGGATSQYTDLEPAGVLTPMDPYLILPDVTDPAVIKKTWLRGELWWVDPGHLVLATLMGPYVPLAINTNLVKSGEIKSYNDFLDPKWKGKISINDPTLPGSTFPSFINDVMGTDYLRKLAKQEPVIMRDQRLQGEWLAHGKQAIALGIKDSTYAEFKSARAPIQVLIPAEGTWLSGDSATEAVIDKPAHPNAAKVFVNWMITKEVQTILSRLAGTQSGREDVPADFIEPELRRQPGAKYWEAFKKDKTLKKADEFPLFKEIFAPLIK